MLQLAAAASSTLKCHNPSEKKFKFSKYKPELRAGNQFKVRREYLIFHDITSTDGHHWQLATLFQNTVVSISIFQN